MLTIRRPVTTNTTEWRLLSRLQFCNGARGVSTHRMDKQNEAVLKEFKAVQSILDEAIKLGLLWDVSVVDLNEKRDPVSARHP